MIGENTADEVLYQRALEGDRKSFEAIYDRYAGRLYHYFRRMLNGDEELAKDQTQEIFIKLIQKGETYNPDRPFKTWVFSMAHNMCKNIYRHRDVEQRASEQLKVVKTSSTDTSGMDRKKFKSALETELLKFDKERRNIFILRYKIKLSVKEISELTEIPEGTVKSKLFYTIKKLSQSLVEFNPKT